MNKLENLLAGLVSTVILLNACYPVETDFRRSANFSRTNKISEIEWPELKLENRLKIDSGEISEEVKWKAGVITIPHYRLGAVQIGKEKSLLINGTGFILGDKYFTPYHVADDSIVNGVVGNLFVSGCPLEFAGGSVKHDVAVFQVPKELEELTNDYFFQSNSKIYIGQQIVIYGNPLSYFFEHSEGKFERGVVTDLNYGIARGDSISFGYIWFRGKVDFGDSGSPVFDARTGDVLGMVTNKHYDGTGGYFAPISWCEEFVLKKQ